MKLFPLPLIALSISLLVVGSPTVSQCATFLPVILSSHQLDGRLIPSPHASQASVAGIITDPVLAYSTYFGGSADDQAWAIDVDDSGYTYFAGVTYSADFPLLNPLDSTLGGTSDITITKLSPDGHTVLFSTYFGGSSEEDYPDLTVAPDGCIYVVGHTASADFPTSNAYDSTFAGVYDVFVLKLNRDGTVAYSTLLGSAGQDQYARICIDSEGFAYVGATTTSIDLPVVNAFDSTHNGSFDMYLVKLAVDGRSLLYATYVGGSANDVLTALAVDAAGCLYFSGQGSSGNFPTTPLAFNRVYGGNMDGYAAKLSADGASLVYSTFIGGSAYDGGHGIALDRDGFAYVGGGTGSSNFPLKNPIDNTFSGGGADAFLLKLSVNGDSLVYSTFLGASGWDTSQHLIVDDSGRLIAGAVTATAGFPTTDAFDSTFGGVQDGILLILSKTGTSMIYGTYLGGADDEFNNALALGPDGAIYFAGYTRSADFPVVSAFDSTYNGGYDAFLMIFKSSPFLCGDADGNTIVTISDAVYLINYIFAGGPAPNPDLSGDADCSGFVTISDAVYLINFIFAGGPAPCAACP